MNKLSSLKVLDNTGHARVAVDLISFNHECPAFVYVLTRARDLH
jgi:hypothetical protein